MKQEKHSSQPLLEKVRFRDIQLASLFVFSWFYESSCSGDKMRFFSLMVPFDVYTVCHF